MDAPLIYERIRVIMSELGAIGKENTNKEQGFKFQSIDDFYNKSKELFAKQGVFTTCEVVSERSEVTESTNDSGKVRKLFWHVVHCRYTFWAPDGSKVTTDSIGKASDYADKAGNKSMAYAHKYALKQILLVTTKDDEDGDLESPGNERKSTGGAPATTRPETGDVSKVREQLDEFLVGAVNAGRLTAAECNKEMAEFDKKPDSAKGPYAAYIMQRYART
jgi:hypothetical protein